MTKTWLRHENPHFSRTKADRALASAFYTGDGVAAHLRQYASGESKAAFTERQALAHADPHLALVIDTLAGMVMETPPERDFGALGDVDAPGTAAYALFRDADGTGTGYRALLQQAAIEALLYNEVWALVDPAATADGRGRPRVKLLPTLSVTDWVEGAGNGVAEALVKETVDGRRSVTAEPKTVEQYVLYTPQGWARYQEADGKAVLVGEGLYAAETGRVYVTRDGEPTAPVVRVRLPFRRYVAGQLAKSARALFSKRSDRDALQRAASYPKLVLTASDDEYTEIVDGLRKGANTLRLDPAHTGSHAFIAPSMDGVRAATETLAQDTQAFYQTAFRLMEAEGRASRTATEAVLDRSSGLSAALGLVSAAMEELERGVLGMCEQVVSDRPSDWTSDVTYGADYSDASLDLGPVPAPGSRGQG